MSQKVEKPVLSGQRIKTRKRDEKERYDPIGFRDAIISGLDKCANDFEGISRYLDGAGNKLDYRRYGECLFDILIAGGILVPGGTLSQEGDGPHQTDACIFNASDDINMEEMKNWEQVFIKLMRRYKYLEKIFQDEIKKILMFVKYFKETDRKKLSAMLALWISNGSVPCSTVLVLNNSHLVKDHLALDFLIDIFKYWRTERGSNSLMSAIRKANLEQHFASFIPDTKQSQVYFRNAFQDNGLEEILKLYEDQHQQAAKKELQTILADALAENKPQRDIISELKEITLRDNIQEHETVCIIWTTVMDIPEWSKKEELVTDQAVRHLKQYTVLFSAFSQGARAEISLVLKVQEYCYSNMTFMRAFQKIIMLFYKTDVISEQTILKWYRQDYNVKGKMMFVDQMKQFVEWLQNAEEESDSEDGESD
ncbi:protein krasavietz [Anthonomus grandis grandis]|uniref:protein krasavietz n=1 Tax=Anthonomus grandis grandis TaxID=2921223 RepID=UPI0021655009|nr:protein krasavietz [Anthonomus grandis grandis]XP_050295505.1 protein krasavietz [Anthonomus grandis grandis]